ncbi:MAG: tyrosine-type recombinase/integrase [Verrucomicrobia bacterium]|nr:tyrosine-type recombinase/integrase [Verrucomicrobiota bacterium]
MTVIGNQDRKDTNDLAIVPVGDHGPLVAIDEELLRDVEGSLAPNTRRAYQRQNKAFLKWCHEEGRSPMPASADTLAGYLGEMAARGVGVSTMNQALAAIMLAHRVAGFDPPSGLKLTFKWRRIRREKKTAPRKAAPILTGDLRLIISALPRTPIGLRDRALLLTGFVGAFRRSELVALMFEDVAFTGEGVRVFLPQSKTDQEGQGVEVPLPHGRSAEMCPVRALRDWLEIAAINSGTVFRRVDRHGNIGNGSLSGRGVALIVQRVARKAGLDVERISAHSLRSGLATAAAKAGKPEHAIMRQGRWKSHRVMQGYIQAANLFEDSAAAGLL